MYISHHVSQARLKTSKRESDIQKHYNTLVLDVEATLALMSAVAGAHRSLMGLMKADNGTILTRPKRL